MVSRGVYGPAILTHSSDGRRFFYGVGLIQPRETGPLMCCDPFHLGQTDWACSDHIRSEWSSSAGHKCRQSREVAKGPPSCDKATRPRSLGPHYTEERHTYEPTWLELDVHRVSNMTVNIHSQIGVRVSVWPVRRRAQKARRAIVISQQ